jgi:hypothetical protein
MAADIYETYYLTLDGITSFENTSIELTGQGEDQDVFSTLKGWCGQSLAPRKTMISFEMNVPSSGPEIDVFKRWNAGAIVPFEVTGALNGKRYAGDCVIRNPKLSAGVGKTSVISAELHAAGSQFE